MPRVCIEARTALGTEYLPWVSAGYVALTASICAFEAKRIRASGPDVLSVFMVLFLLQCCVPGIVIFACLPFTGLSQPTDNETFDRIFAAMDLSSALMVLGLTACFVVFIYVFMAAGAILMRRLLPAESGRASIVLRGSDKLMLAVISFALVLTLITFWQGGDTLVERYINLIEERGGSEKVEYSTLNNLAFLLLQGWLWLSVVALFVLFERRGRTAAWYFCLVCMLIFALLATSRRALFIPILLAYLTLVLFDGRWRMKFILLALIPILVWVAFGKEIFNAVAAGRAGDGVYDRYQTFSAGALRTASDVGITVVESLGSMSLLDLPPRFGVDHLISVVQGPPIQWILHWTGSDRALPIRMVRLSTVALAGPYAEDFPPGLLGQMWLDFRIFGPMVWAFALAVQLSVVQRVFALMVRTRQAVAVVTLLTFVIALPLNSGSYDFTFSDDTLVAVLCLFLTFKVVRIRLRRSAEGEGLPCE